MGVFHAAIVGAILLHGADAVTTNAVLAHPHTREVGLLPVALFGSHPSSTETWVYQGSVAAGFAYLEYRLAKHHHTLAWTIVLAEAAAEGWAVHQNLHVVERR